MENIVAQNSREINKVLIDLSRTGTLTENIMINCCSDTDECVSYTELTLDVYLVELTIINDIDMTPRT